MRRKSPVTVQQWLDSLPITKTQSTDSGCINNNHNNRLELPARYSVKGYLMRDVSIQSDDTSNCSSIESMLELRKPDPEAVLLGLGFGPPKTLDYLAKIPKRFLNESRLNGIDISKFLEEQESLRSFDCQLSPRQFVRSQTQSSPVSPIHSCDNSQNISKKNSF